MKAFAYIRSNSVDDALSSIAQHANAKYLGGGTNLVDLMKTGVEKPSALVDVSRLPLATIEARGDGVNIGAMASNSAVASHPLILERYPVLAQALLAGASAQIRNMATVGGNLLQRTRCFYFYDPSYTECNKRVPGSGCAAMSGYNRIHSIVGGSDHCIAVHPSDMAVALTALDAAVVVGNKRRERIIPFRDFYRLPGDTPNIETDLAPDDMIMSVALPAPISRHSTYLKIRDRNSFAFALVSVAAILDLDVDKRIRDARIAIGGIAPKPWRVPSAEQALTGQLPTEAAFARAAEILLEGAKPLRYNGFKVELTRRAVMRALSTASAS